MKPYDLFEAEVCRDLNEILQRTVWNEPAKQYRRTIKPCPAARLTQIGTWDLRTARVALPAMGVPYVAYIITSEGIADLGVATYQWRSLAEIWNTEQVDIRVTGPYGEMLYRPEIYIMKHPRSDDVLMVIDRAMADTILAGVPNALTSLKVSIYVDSDLLGQISITWAKSIASTTTTDNRTLLKTQADAADIVYINGREAQINTISDFGNRKYVEIVTDGNIIGEFTVDVTSGTEFRTYVSPSLTGDGTRAVLHIPKAVNPTMAVIGHTTCDVFIRPTTGTAPHLQGLLYQRGYQLGGLIQLTHQDFALDTSILDDYSVRLMAQGNLEIRVVVRTHSTNNVLVRERSYLDLLYLNDDTTIVDFLVGEGPEAITSWSAAVLETYKYTASLIDVPDTQPNTLDWYIDTLGLNNAAGLTNFRVFRFRADLASLRTYRIQLPWLFRYQDILPMVFVNGVKVDQTLLGLETLGTLLTVTIDPSVVVTAGAYVVIELFESGISVATYTPIQGAATYTITGVDADVYVKSQLGSYTPPFVGVTISGSYTPSLATKVFSDTGVTVTAVQGDYGALHLVTSATGCELVHKSTWSATAGTVPSVISTGPLMFAESAIPVVGDGTFLVFLNGRELVPEVDYHLTTAAVIPPGRVVANDIIVSNLSYIQAVNTLEVWFTKDKLVDQFHGFHVKEFLTQGEHILTWNHRSGMVFVNGKAVANLTPGYGTIQLNDPLDRNGAIYHSRTLISKSILNLFERTGDSATDSGLLAEITAYTQTILPEPDGIAMINNSHRIYSVYAARIIQEVLAGGHTLTYDPGNMPAQVTGYASLKLIDPAFLVESLEYIDVYPTWFRPSTSDQTQWSALTQLIKEVLPSDTLTHGDTPNDQ